jgi:hypothetical protein
MNEFSRPFATSAIADLNLEPGSELPGYSQFSLREMFAEKCPNSRPLPLGGGEGVRQDG